MTHQDISFTSHGETCRGRFRPGPGVGPAPAILLSHGLSATMDQGLDGFAEAFGAAGLATLVIDHRGLGTSDGTRGLVVPERQQDDLRAALGWLSNRPEVDAARLGLWGTSYAGGNALALAAQDPRVKAVVAQAPAVSVGDCFRRLLGDAAFAGLQAMLAAEHLARSAGAAPAAIPVVDPSGGPCALPTPDSAEWFLANAVPGWENRITLSSVARALEFTPEATIHRITPRPLLVIAAEHDSLIPLDLVRAAFDRAGEPKRLVTLPCGHFDMYPGRPFHAGAATEARDWFRAALA